MGNYQRNVGNYASAYKVWAVLLVTLVGQVYCNR